MGLAGINVCPFFYKINQLLEHFEKTDFIVGIDCVFSLPVLSTGRAMLSSQCRHQCPDIFGFVL